MKVYSHILLQLTAGYCSTYTAAEPICNSNVDSCDVSTPLVVESYDIYNGSQDPYVDDKYPGGPNAAQVQLVDGQGDLTDNIIPQISWKFNDAVRSDPYVGYLRTSPPGSLSANDAIPFDFMFTQDETVSKVEISVDDPLPASSGGVTAPDKVIIGGTEYNFPPNTAGAQTGPYTATIELTEPVFVSMGSPLNIQLIPVPTENRQCREAEVDKICVWVFVSEFKFFEPCSASLLACKEEERAKCCYKTDGCPGARKLDEATLEKKSFSNIVEHISCFLGADVFSKESTELCREECFAYGDRLCFIKEEFGLLHECDDW